MHTEETCSEVGCHREGGLAERSKFHVCLCPLGTTRRGPSGDPCPRCGAPAEVEWVLGAQTTLEPHEIPEDGHVVGVPAVAVPFTVCDVCEFRYPQQRYFDLTYGGSPFPATAAK